jgi:phosphatidylserine decarboxylase
MPPLETLDPAIDSIQPGGGVCMSIELAWGRLRRAWLKTFRRKYLARMNELRQGDPTGCPHEVLDPRDLKFYVNQTTCHWRAEDDPFQWRGWLPFVRLGLAELLLMGGGLLAAITAFIVAGVMEWLPPWLAAIGVLGLTPLAAIIFWFFRTPRRTPPVGDGLIVSPADGRIVAIEKIEHDEFIGGPAVVVAIFLSIFNVHVNRSPVPAKVIGLSYRRGKFFNAARPEASRENEQMAMRLVATAAPHRRLIVKQITGAVARRIVCQAKPGDILEVGQMYGMIKLGSRTEIVLPDTSELRLEVAIGDKVKAGETIFGRWIDAGSIE